MRAPVAAQKLVVMALLRLGVKMVRGGGLIRMVVVLTEPMIQRLGAK